MNPYCKTHRLKPTTVLCVSFEVKFTKQHLTLFVKESVRPVAGNNVTQMNGNGRAGFPLCWVCSLTRHRRCFLQYKWYSTAQINVEGQCSNFCICSVIKGLLYLIFLAMSWLFQLQLLMTLHSYRDNKHSGHLYFFFCRRGGGRSHF